MPKDFSYDELIRLLKLFGFEEHATGKTAGSRVRFINSRFPGYPVLFHKPHPERVIKSYVLKDVLTVLLDCGLLKNKANEKNEQAAK
ncbi:MAG: type II toxin-antitoxin system HicA family toxin [Mangrovibacterium sp.]